MGKFISRDKNLFVHYDKEAYIQALVDREDKIRFANVPPIKIPKMNYPSDISNWNLTSKYAFIRQIYSLMP